MMILLITVVSDFISISMHSRTVARSSFLRASDSGCTTGSGVFTGSEALVDVLVVTVADGTVEVVPCKDEACGFMDVVERVWVVREMIREP